MAAPERVTVVAAGCVTPIGSDLETFWSSLVTGVSGISQIERVPVADLRVRRGGEVKKLGRIKDWRGVPVGRATRLLVAAADDLCAQCGFRPLPLPPARVGVVVGTALGGVEEGEKALSGASARRLRDALYDGPGDRLARWLGARGPVITVSTACASGATALAVGADLLRSGEADISVALDGPEAESIKADKRMQVVPSKHASIFWLEFAEQWDPKSPWADRRMRLAVNHALPRQKINEAACLGFCPPAGVIVPRVMDFALQVEPPAYDLQKVKQLLTEAGYPNGLDAGEFTPISMPLIGAPSSMSTTLPASKRPSITRKSAVVVWPPSIGSRWCATAVSCG